MVFIQIKLGANKVSESIKTARIGVNSSIAGTIKE